VNTPFHASRYRGLSAAAEAAKSGSTMPDSVTAHPSAAAPAPRERCARCAGYGWVRAASMGYWSHSHPYDETPAWPRYFDAYAIEYAVPRARGAHICPDCRGNGTRRTP